MLSEKSSLFSQIASGQKSPVTASFSVVEIKEKDLTSKMIVQNINLEIQDSNETIQSASGVHILESIHAFEPEYVETVNIVDASSDTDTGSTPQLNDRRKISSDSNTIYDSADELEYELERELESINGLNPYNSISEVDIRSTKVIRIEKQRISFEERRTKLRESKDRDILRDSEVNIDEPIRVNSDQIMEVRDSFYGSDKENDDEPLAFSEDEDIPRYSMEMATDSDSDVV